MFVKYLTEEQIASLGFTPANPCNLYPETFSIQKINCNDIINTLFSLWGDNNLFQYQIYTDKEGTILRGKLTRFKELKALVEQYIDDDIISFFERKNNKKYNILKKHYLRKKYNVKNFK